MIAQAAPTPPSPGPEDRAVTKPPGSVRPSFPDSSEESAGWESLNLTGNQKVRRL